MFFFVMFVNEFVIFDSISVDKFKREVLLMFIIVYVFEFVMVIFGGLFVFIGIVFWIRRIRFN